MLGKIGLLLLGICLLSAAPVFADSTTTFTFISPAGMLGTSQMYTSGSLSLVATGWSNENVPAAMWGKNAGANEMGLGLAAEPQHEISGTEFIQLNLTSILAASPSGITLSIDSIQTGDTYDVWGSTTAGMKGTPLGTSQTGATFPLTVTGLDPFISLSAPTGNVLLEDVEVTIPTPEPNSATLLLFGLAALIGVGTLGKKLFV